MLTLAIDASTYLGTTALIRDGEIIAEQAAPMRGEHEERLMPAVARVLDSTGISVSNLDAVACGEGPGSFTSLRIAASIAKGIAVSVDLPLFVASSPLLVVTAATPPLDAGTYLAALDAMRGDIFALTVVVEADGAIHADGRTLLGPRASIGAHAAALGAVLVGPGESRALAPHARGFAPLMRQRLVREVDRARWEPEYGRKAEAQVRWEQAHGRPLESP